MSVVFSAPAFRPAFCRHENTSAVDAVRSLPGMVVVDAISGGWSTVKPDPRFDGRCLLCACLPVAAVRELARLSLTPGILGAAGSCPPRPLHFS